MQGSNQIRRSFKKTQPNKTQVVNHSSVNKFSESDKADILIEFPKIELSYETIVHNKVQYDYMVAIPMGKKFFAWFTTYKDQNVCLLLEAFSQSGVCKQILSVQPVITSFDTSLCLGSCGTIVYGTCFNYKQNRFFSLEDCFYYKGAKQERCNKLSIFKRICEQDLGRYAFNSQCLVFGLPIIQTDYPTLVKQLEELPYKIYSVQCYNFSNSDIFTFRHQDFLQTFNVPDLVKPAYVKQPTAYAKPEATYVKPLIKPTATNNYKPQIFKVVPDIQADIYYLVDENGKRNVAYIPNYETSVMMNKLFRTIKENANLDALEESDDEEEFENSQLDKFVFLDKSYKMSCTYNHKFKKWIPTKVVQ
jgi:hypothetical protein